ncbi:MAG: glycosyltransferase [Pseudomonadota bacterium]
MNNRLFPAHHIYPVYLDWLRQLRRKAHTLWLQGMQAGAAVVNLPHLVKGYSSRVIEGIASGRPVISWEIPDRPKNTAMFEDGHEILLYSTPEQLATQIERVLSDPDFGERIAQNARNKVRRFHTTEKRVQQILHWVETDEAQDYSDQL